MKFILGLIMCSSVYNTCLPPYEWPETFNSHYECMIFGYEESLNKAKEILTTLSDKALSNMLKQRRDTNSDFKQAILSEMARRCTIEYLIRYGSEL